MLSFKNIGSISDLEIISRWAVLFSRIGTNCQSLVAEHFFIF